MPLPPYIHREANTADEREYQTVFAKNDGAVAAPTAGLHITDSLLQKIKNKGIHTGFVTLHVGAGTFQPVEHENVLEHPMHVEQMVFDRALIRQLSAGSAFVIALGTTSLRALESLYWFGHQLQTQPDADRFFVSKLQPYKQGGTLSLKRSMKNVLQWMNEQKTDILQGETQIFIFPGYQFQVCNGLITNFHLPKSTLLMLVSAFIGDDWKRLYNEALENDYRFLSYGDGMLLMREFENLKI
jgi:S-adenosylmethionine:tRNA ribosyltransferase-isomerase